MDFLFTINDSYVEPIKTLIFSIAFNNGNSNDFHFIYNDLSEENRNDIQNYINNTKLGTAHFYPFNYDLQGITSKGSWSMEVYYRLFAPQILEELDKVLYLDGDTIVNADISELYNLDLHSYAFAAVENDTQDEHISRLHLDNNCKYYNAGVLLLNLSKMRDRLSSINISEFLSKHKEEFIFQDQDFLNKMFSHSILTLDTMYNYMINLTERNIGYPIIKQPKIIHYVLEKPWKEYSEYLTDYYYLKYLYKRGNKLMSFRLFLNHRLFRMKNMIKGFMTKSQGSSKR